MIVRLKTDIEWGGVDSPPPPEECSPEDEEFIFRAGTTGDAKWNKTDDAWEVGFQCSDGEPLYFGLHGDVLDFPESQYLGVWEGTHKSYHSHNAVEVVEEYEEYLKCYTERDGYFLQTKEFFESGHVRTT